MKQDEYSTARARPKTEHRDQTNLIERFYKRAFVKSEARPAIVRLNRAAKLVTVFGFTTKHAVCRITFMLWLVLL